jgi:hypothetical protein
MGGTMANQNNYHFSCIYQTVAALLLISFAATSINGDVRVTSSTQLTEKNTTFIIDSMIVMTGNINVDPSSDLKFSRGGIVSTKSHTLIINGGIEAGHFQIFQVDPMGKVKGNPKVHYIVPHWFKHPDSSNWAFAFQKAIELVPELGGTVYIPAGKYWLDTTVFIPYQPTTGYDQTVRNDPQYSAKRVTILGETFYGDRQADSSFKSVILTGGANGNKNYPAFRINSRDDDHPAIGNFSGNQYNKFQIKNLFIQNSKWQLVGTGIYALNFADCMFENLYFDHLEYGINSSGTDSVKSYNEQIIVRNVLFRNIKETCFHGGRFNDALLIENCYILKDFSNDAVTPKTKTGFYINEGQGINIIGGIYNGCETVFHFRNCGGINISGIYCESDQSRIFYLSQTSPITIQNCYLDISSLPSLDPKLMFLEGDRCKNIQFIGNRILVKQNNGENRIFAQNDTGTYNACLHKMIFLGNQIGWRRGTSLSTIDDYELPAADQRLCRLYTPLHEGFNANGNVFIDGTLQVKDGIRAGYTTDAVAGTIRWNPDLKKLQVFDGRSWIDLH